MPDYDLEILINYVNDDEMKTIVKMIELGGRTVRLQCHQDSLHRHRLACVRGYHVQNHNLIFCSLCNKTFEGRGKALEHLISKHDTKDIIRFSIMGDE